MMKIICFFIGIFFFSSSTLWAQEEINQAEESFGKIKLKLYKKTIKEIYEGDFIDVVYLPELPIYPELVFKNARQIRSYNRLVHNVKKTLPIAKQIHDIIIETHYVLETLPTEKDREEHINMVEKSLRKQYEPQMRKLSYSQGKLLIKLVDRECKQSSYEIVKAFFGTGKAMFYQAFAYMFRASLKKEYRPESDDKLIERVVRQVEAGVL